MLSPSRKEYLFSATKFLCVACLLYVSLSLFFGVSRLAVSFAGLVSEPGPFLFGISWELVAVALVALFLLLSVLPKLLGGFPRMFPPLEAWRLRAGDPFSFLSKAGLVVGILLVLLSDVSTRRYAFYEASAPFFICIFGLFSAFCLYQLCRSYEFAKVLESTFSFRSLVLIQLFVAVCFLKYAGTDAVFSDDHPAFIYRLALLQKEFPFIPFYNPDWEAGYSAREFFASGILNFAFLISPLLFLSKLSFGLFQGPDFATLAGTSVYNYCLAWVFIILAPMAMYAAARVLRYNRVTASIAGILALAPTLGYFEWLLKYGTLGFCTSVAFLPLALALCYSLAFDEEKPGVLRLLAGVLAASFCFTWTLSAFAFLPLVFLAFCRFRDVFDVSRRWYLLSFIFLFLGINLPWLLIFFEESKVFSFLSQSGMPGLDEKAAVSAGHTIASLEAEARSALKAIRGFFFRGNPLLLLAVSLGFLSLQTERKKQFLYFTISFLVVTAFLGEMFKPQLELKRMIVPALFIACIPAARCIASLLEAVFSALSDADSYYPFWKKTIAFVSAALVLGSLLYSPVTAALAYQNRTIEKFIVQPKALERFVDSLGEHKGSGRVFFSGFALQELGETSHNSQDGGHLAPLAAFADASMYSFFYYHSHWTTVDPIPMSFRKKGPAGIEEFLDLIHATSVVAFKSEWVRYFRRFPDRYKEIFSWKRYFLFTRVVPESSYFYEGNGVLEVLDSGMRLRLGSETAVIKFRYLPKLKAFPAEVQLRPEFIFEEETGKKSKAKVYYVRVTIPPELVGEDLYIGYRPERLLAE